MGYELAQLLKLKQGELDELFANAEPGPIPNGEGKGIALIAPDTIFSKEVAEMINIFIWKGKVFKAEKKLLVNEVTTFAIQAVVAEIRYEPSWVDGNKCIVLDYSRTSAIAHWVRDELRYLGNGLYLGVVFWDKDRLFDFALQFDV